MHHLLQPANLKLYVNVNRKYPAGHSPISLLRGVRIGDLTRELENHSRENKQQRDLNKKINQERIETRPLQLLPSILIPKTKLKSLRRKKVPGFVSFSRALGLRKIDLVRRLRFLQIDFEVPSISTWLPLQQSNLWIGVDDVRS